jgi:hypothetical protein
LELLNNILVAAHCVVFFNLLSAFTFKENEQEKIIVRSLIAIVLQNFKTDQFQVRQEIIIQSIIGTLKRLNIRSTLHIVVKAVAHK